MGERAVILMDGGFVKKRLYGRLGRHATAADISAECQTILLHPRLAGKVLFRVFYYDSPPFEGASTHPISRQQIRYSTEPTAIRNAQLLRDLDLQPDFAVRRGTLLHHGWKLTNAAVRDLQQGPRQLQADDFKPDFEQKQVDIKIGLDIAWIALKGIAETMVLVSGDSDMVPAMKFARKEGVRLFLHTLGNANGVREELKAHADVVLG